MYVHHSHLSRRHWVVLRNTRLVRSVVEQQQARRDQLLETHFYKTYFFYNYNQTHLVYESTTPRGYVDNPVMQCDHFDTCTLRDQFPTNSLYFPALRSRKPNVLLLGTQNCRRSLILAKSEHLSGVPCFWFWKFLDLSKKMGTDLRYCICFFLLRLLMTSEISRSRLFKYNQCSMKIHKNDPQKRVCVCV